MSVGMKTRLPNSVCRFCTCRSGIAAIEAAILLPVFVFMFVNCVVLFDVLRVERAVSRASMTLVDLATRTTQIDEDQQEELFDVVNAIVGSGVAEANTEIVLTSVINETGDNADKLSVRWSVSSKGKNGALDDEDLARLNLPSVPESNSILFATVSVKYRSSLDRGFSVIGKKTFSATAMRRPRFSSEVAYIED